MILLSLGMATRRLRADDCLAVGRSIFSVSRLVQRMKATMMTTTVMEGCETHDVAKIILAEDSPGDRMPRKGLGWLGRGCYYCLSRWMTSGYTNSQPNFNRRNYEDFRTEESWSTPFYGTGLCTNPILHITCFYLRFCTRAILPLMNKVS